MIRLPWISRALHVEMVNLLTDECDELKSERRILLDRLASLGFGGPLFQEGPEATLAAAPEEELAASSDELLLDQLSRLRRRPAKLADTLTRQFKKVTHGFTPAMPWPQSRIDAVRASLDQAEAAGREAAIAGKHKPDALPKESSAGAMLPGESAR